MKMKTGDKELFYGLKVSPTSPDPAQLAKINTFTKRPFTADELYIGQMRLANNCIDRDNERFSEFTLQGFVDSAVRKSVLLDHSRSVKSAIGKFFDCELETMPLAQAIAETGADLKLPVGVNEVQFMSPWFYIPKKGIEETDLVKLEAGIFDFTSIGFKTKWPVPVNDGLGNILYHEYQGAGETREGSLVYLGAQHGASVKSADNEPEHKESTEGEESMKILLAGIGVLLGKSFGEGTAEQTVVDEIKTVVAGKDAKITELETKLKALEPLAEDGKGYREQLVNDTLKYMVVSDDIKADEESQKKEKAFLSTLPLDRLKTMKEKAEAAARVKVPDHSEFKGKETPAADANAGKKSLSAMIAEGMK